MSIDEIKNDDSYALHAAASAGDLSLVKELIKTKKLTFDLRNAEGETPLFCATRLGRLDDALKDTLLHIAVKIGSSELVTYLVTELKMDLHTKNAQGETPLKLAHKYQHPHLIKFLADFNQTSRFTTFIGSAVTADSPILGGAVVKNISDAEAAYSRAILLSPRVNASKFVQSQSDILVLPTEQAVCGGCSL